MTQPEGASYTRAAWVEAMRKLGGSAEVVGLALAQVADDEGRLPRDYRSGLGARCGLTKDPTRRGLHVLRSNGALIHLDDGAALKVGAFGGTSTAPTRVRATRPPTMIYRFDSERQRWDEPADLGEYLRRKVAA